MQSTSRTGLHRPASSTSIVALVAILAYPVLAVGCASGDDVPGSGADSSGATVVDSSGVEVVTNRGAGWGPEEAWQLVADLQVGELDGPLAFGRITWVSPGPDDGMLVLDGQSQLVHVFDSAGRAVGRFGGEGEGPGEFRRPAAVTPLSDGRVAVSEGFPPVLHWLTIGGEFVGSTRLPSARDEAAMRTVGTFGAWQVSPAGRAFVQVQVFDPGAEDGGIPVVLLEVDPDAHRVRVNGQSVTLSALEFRLLNTFLESQGRVQTREMLLDKVWDIHAEIQTRTVDVHVKRLRTKLGEAGDYIKTLRGVGYRLVSRPDEEAT